MTPEYRQAQRWNIVWVVPILALLIGGWMIYRSVTSQGPIAHVRFETADGIAAGKTEVRCRSVRVGVVKDVKLADDLKSVVVMLELTPDSVGLLRTGHQFLGRPAAGFGHGCLRSGNLDHRSLSRTRSRASRRLPRSIISTVSKPRWPPIRISRDCG